MKCYVGIKFLIFNFQNLGNIINFYKKKKCIIINDKVF